MKEIKSVKINGGKDTLRLKDKVIVPKANNANAIGTISKIRDGFGAAWITVLWPEGFEGEYPQWDVVRA